MGNKLSRRLFLKGAGAGVLGAAAAGLVGVSAFAEAAGTYTPGTYSATATSMGEVVVTMTFDAESITDVQIDVSNETPGIGADIGDQMAAAILAAQSAEVDGVTSATITSNAIRQAADACIAQAKGGAVDTGTVAEEAKATWRTPPEPIPDDEIAETLETEIAIVGLGHAGLAVLRSAAENGADVIAVEAQPRDTWWTIGHDIGSINAEFTKQFGVPEVDVVEFMNNWQLQTQSKSNPALVMAFAKNSGAALDWYLEPAPQEYLDKVHLTYWPENDKTIHQLNNGLRYYTGTVQWWEKFWADPTDKNSANNTPGLLEIKDFSYKNMEYVEANFPNAKAMFGTRGCQLIKEGDTVTGVIVKDADGKYIRILAKKGVVLCGGGFGGNQEMMADLLPNLQRNFTPEEGFMAPFDRDGSTIQMGVWVGGRLEGDISTMNFDSLAIPDSIPGPLWVDDNGERFQNEAFAGPELNGFFSARAMRGKMIAIYDSKYPEQILRGFPSHGAFEYDDEDQVNLKLNEFAASKDAGAEGANGFYCAETLEELANYIGVDPETFLATVARYNELCEGGLDEDFGKDPRFMNAIVDGPFYAHVTTPSLGFALVTTGAFVTNAHQQILDENYKPIGGLFASGNTCGMRFGATYITPIPGVSIGMCITLGRELGKYLAAK